MRLLKPLIAIVALLFFASTAHGALIDVSGNAPGHVQFPYSEAAVSFRPTSPSQKSLTVTDYFIHDLINQKGLDVRASRQSNAPAWAYESITLKNLKISNVERREDLPGGNGLHIDHIRIAGGGNSQDVKTNILIENVIIDGGDALPILITDGIYGTVTLRNVQIKNTTLNNVQFKTDRVGSVDRIIIDNSPGIGVALIGRPGSVGEVLVRNSPDVRLGDSLNATGRTGAIISYIDGISGASGSQDSLILRPAIGGGAPFASNVPAPVDVSSVPEPAGLLVFALMIPMLRRRR
jgi:hypothetical protein